MEAVARVHTERVRPRMDRKIEHPSWSPRRLTPGQRVGASIVLVALIALGAIGFLFGGGGQTLRVSTEQVSFSTVEQGVFQDLIPLHTTAVPRETVYVDATDGGRVDRLLVEAGDVVEEGQPMIELSNTNLALQVIQQESQLNQAISQLQQNEIALEQNDLANARALAEIDYNVVRLNRSAGRRDSLAAKGVLPEEQRDEVKDQLAYYQKLRPVQADSSRRQADMRERLLPDIHGQLKILRGNLAVVHNRLDSLVIRAPVAGKVTSLDLRVGENRVAGQRLAEVTPDAGMKLVADVDQFYLNRVRAGQQASVTLNDAPVEIAVRRVLPQVRNGTFRIELDLGPAGHSDLVSGATAEGRLRLGEDTPAVVIPNGPFIERTGGEWIFVVSSDGGSAQRRKIQIGRRTSEQLEVLSGLNAGERVITSDYTSLDKADRVVLTH